MCEIPHPRPHPLGVKPVGTCTHGSDCHPQTCHVTRSGFYTFMWSRAGTTAHLCLSYVFAGKVWMLTAHWSDGLILVPAQDLSMEQWWNSSTFAHPWKERRRVEPFSCTQFGIYGLNGIDGFFKDFQSHQQGSLLWSKRRWNFEKKACGGVDPILVLYCRTFLPLSWVSLAIYVIPTF